MRLHENTDDFLNFKCKSVLYLYIEKGIQRFLKNYFK